MDRYIVSRMLTTLIVVCTLSILIAAAVTFLAPHFINIENTGEIRTVGVNLFWDKNCTLNVTKINFGFIEPNETVTYTLFLKNIKNVPVTVNYTTSNWKPENVSQYIQVSWSHTETNVLQPEEITLINYSLHVKPDIYDETNGLKFKNFNFTWTVKGWAF